MRARWLSVVFVALALLAAPARASDKAACLEAASNGQTLRDAHKLVAARDQFRACAAAACPGVVQSDCARWLDAVERALPTVVVGARDRSGHDLVDVTVSVDGHPFVSRIDGHAVPIDPGPHSFHFEAADGSAADDRRVIPEGEESQSVIAVLGMAAPLVNVGATASPSGTLGGSPSPPMPLRTTGFAVGGVGLAALAAGAVLGLLASGAKNNYENECGASIGAPPGACSAQGIRDHDAARTKATLSDAFFIGGSVVAAAGVTLVLITPRTGAAETHLTAGAGGLSVGGRF